MATSEHLHSPRNSWNYCADMILIFGRNTYSRPSTSVDLLSPRSRLTMMRAFPDCGLTPAAKCWRGFAAELVTATELQELNLLDTLAPHFQLTDLDHTKQVRVSRSLVFLGRAAPLHPKVRDFSPTKRWASVYKVWASGLHRRTRKSCDTTPKDVAS